MQKIRIEEIKNIIEYEKVRPEFRKRVVDLKKNRRLAVGNIMTLVFENRETVLFQIQEMVRIERMVRESAIQNEIDTYNVLIPNENELSATMLIEIQEINKIKEMLDTLVGLPRDCVWIELGDNKIFATFDLEQSDDDRISAVQYIKFAFTPRQSGLFKNSSVPVILKVDHPNYKHSVPISGEIRNSLITDFLS